MDWKEKKVLVVGMGKSGLAAAEVLNEKGSCITICDIKDEAQLQPEAEKLRNQGIQVITGRYPQVSTGYYDLIIISPGVPLDIPPVKDANRLNIPVWSEVELAYRMARGRIIAVTGTNGKTTTTSLIGQMFLDAKKPVIVAGNIGKPLVKEVQQSTHEHVIVVEVSSFQLESIHNFCPDVAVFLNLTPDHLNRHKTFINYKRSKMNIFKNQTKNEWAVLNYDDSQIRDMINEIESSVLYFSQKNKLKLGTYIKENYVVTNYKGYEDAICSLEDIRLRGSHNLENCLAAVSVALICGLSKEQIAFTLKTFSGVEHRLEIVAKKNGVTFVNDSKGTNPEASLRAIEAYNDKEIILIAGGMDKGTDFTEFARAIKDNVRDLILLGETAPKIKGAVEKIGFTDVYCVNTLKDAVDKAWALANPGDVVLLSPACASWDMFKSYEERGNMFKEFVFSLGG